VGYIKYNNSKLVDLSFGPIMIKEQTEKGSILSEKLFADNDIHKDY
tara:strand:+ start:376 stop:513 length:138 start_codon:yes stop_codon:yes gene_type:complete